MLENVERNRREPKKDTIRVRIVLLSTAGARIQGKVLANVAVSERLRVSAAAVDQVSNAFPALLPPKSQVGAYKRNDLSR